MKRTIFSSLLIITLISSFLFWTIGSDATPITAQEDFTPTPTPHSHVTTSSGQNVGTEVIAIGYEIYLTNECNVCHGDNAEGTDKAPALAGQKRDSIYRHLRAPLGEMPFYSSAEIGFRDVEYLVSYIETLPLPEDAPPPSIELYSLSQVVVSHHWHALWAVQSGDEDEAIHQVEHLIELTAGPHQAMMQTILEQLEAGDLSATQPVLEDMLFGILPSENTPAEDYILASWVMVQEAYPAQAQHYLEHAVELLPEDSPALASIEEISEVIEGEDLAQADALLNKLIAKMMPDYIAILNINLGDAFEHTHIGLTTVNDLVVGIASQGVPTRFGEFIEQPFFSVPAQVIVVNQTETLQVYAYSDEFTAISELKLVDPSGSPIGNVEVSWMMPPHFYYSGHLIVIYLGSDEATLDLLNEVIGFPFAGQ